MTSVGVRELKNRLSEYLRRVKAGETVVVTDRGEVVAELAPPGGSTDDRIPIGLRELAKRGRCRLGKPGPSRGLYPAFGPTRGRYTAAQLLDEERGPR